MKSKFRTIDISDPRFERDGLRYITVKTNNLKGRADITVYKPENVSQDQKLPLLILLHGVYGSHWGWTQKAGVHLIAEQMIQEGEISPMVIAMPSDGLWGDGSGYIKHLSGLNFENWIVDDVPAIIDEQISGFSLGESKVFIAGLSMGGFGALRLGAKYPRKFDGISAHSAITQLEEMQQFVEEDIKQIALINEDTKVSELMIKNRDSLPKLRFDCGLSDSLLPANQKLDQQLLQYEIEHVYEEFAGGHDWEYWRLHIQDTLSFFFN